MAFPSTGTMYTKWLEMSEWKRWFLCWPVMLIVYLISWLSVLGLFMPIAYMKAAEYLIILPSVIPTFALHASIALFLPRAKNFASTVICFLMALALLFSFQSGEPPVWVAGYHMLANLFAFWLIYHNRNEGKDTIIQLYGMFIIATGYILMLLTGLIAFGFIWDGVESVVGGWLVWILFWFVFPIAVLIVPVYEALANGFWMPAVFTWLFPFLSGALIMFGGWIISGRSNN